MKLRRWIVLAAASFATAAGAATMPPGVAWLAAASDADIERAFAHAREQRKPLLLYWGADWCPPCNHLKSTLFNRQDFAQRARAFVPVFVDGDGRGAQKLGRRFRVRGYPTVVLLDADGSEITRLPGEVDAAQVMAVLQQGMAGGRSAQAVLADARADKPLSAAEWRLLAFYPWSADEARLVDPAARPALLAELSVKAPSGELATRLLLKALADSDDGKGLKPDAPTVERVLVLLGDAAATRAQMDVVANAAPDLAKALAPKPGSVRQRVVGALDGALGRLAADGSLSRADRLSALHARIELARLDQPETSVSPTVPPALTQALRKQVARFDREIADGYERQAVITGAAYALGRAGLWADSDALLKANLAKSRSPYYLMSQLGGNARRLGRPDEALRWYQQAFDRSEGPATRLQWGAGYLGALIELAPLDDARIEGAAAAVFREAAQPGAFYERSERSLRSVGKRLVEWNRDGMHADALRRLQAQLGGVCAGLDVSDPQRTSCDALVKSLGAPA
jgi:thioredoxin-like negative regulator of GroEL